MYLFNRSITVNVRSEDEKILKVEGVFLDSQHELSLSLDVDLESYIITAADGELRRAPHLDCSQTGELIKNLVGVNLNHNVRKQVQLAVGLSYGCTHLTDLTLECVKGLLQAKFRLLRLKMKEEEIKGLFGKYLEGNCLHYKKS